MARWPDIEKSEDERFVAQVNEFVAQVNEQFGKLAEEAEANQKTMLPKHWIDEKIAALDARRESAERIEQERLDSLLRFSDDELLEELRRRLWAAR